MPTIRLDRRALILVSGEEAETFLQNLITTDLDHLPAGDLFPGALLAPQGKILFDFLISRDKEGFRLDCRSDICDDLLRRLSLYKLRARVELSKADQCVATVSWQSDSSALTGLADRRFFDDSVIRRYGEEDIEPDASIADWHALRIASGIGESGDDYALGDAFPHDVLMDLNGGVSFRKGCFIGQEVVSRMQHRGTARRRLLIAQAQKNLPAPGTAITADGKKIGSLGSVSGQSGLALVRIDRAAEAEAGGKVIEADGIAIDLSIPAWSGLEFPQSTVDADGPR